MLKAGAIAILTTVMGGAITVLASNVIKVEKLEVRVDQVESTKEMLRKIDQRTSRMEGILEEMKRER
jgi:uncharacterized membrane protein